AGGVMKLKIALMVCSASLFAARPILAQANDDGHGHNGHHGHHGNNSNHSGHDENGSNHSGHDEDGSGQGDDDNGNGEDGQQNLILATPEIRAAVARATTSVTADLRSGSLRAQAGSLISAAAQARTHSVFTADKGDL